MNILILLGGDSPEREIALLSGNNVYEAIKDESSMAVRKYDPLDGDEGLAEAVEWADVVLPILHGVNGEDGTMQRKIEALNTAFLGSSSESSALSFDKHKTHEVLEQTGVVMPKHAVVSKSDMHHPLFTKPYVLKPNANGSSIDTIVVRDPSDGAMRSKSAELLEIYDFMILEELVEGLEITVPVLGEEALPVIAIIPPTYEDFNYENKYNGKTQEICPVPERMLANDIQKQAQDLALKIHHTLHTEHLSRTDMIVTPDGQLVVLELNTMPGMTAESLFPRSAAVAGYDMTALTKRFVELVKQGEAHGSHV